MATIIPYVYKGKNVLKQLGLICPIAELDKPRIWIDFNESVDYDTFLLSRVDIIGDSIGDDVELFEGLRISVFDKDLDGTGKPDYILADGVVSLNTTSLYNEVKWLVKLLPNKMHSKKVYWMSELIDC